MNPLRYLQLAAVLLLLGAGGYGVWSYKHLAAKAATADARIAAAEAGQAALQHQLNTLSAETIRRSEFDAALRDARANVSHNLDNATRESPVARDYLGERIPDSVRGAYAHAPQR